MKPFVRLFRSTRGGSESVETIILMMIIALGALAVFQGIGTSIRTRATATAAGIGGIAIPGDKP